MKKLAVKQSAILDHRGETSRSYRKKHYSHFLSLSLDVLSGQRKFITHRTEIWTTSRPTYGYFDIAILPIYRGVPLTSRFAAQPVATLASPVAHARTPLIHGVPACACTWGGVSIDFGGGALHYFHRFIPRGVDMYLVGPADVRTHASTG